MNRKGITSIVIILIIVGVLVLAGGVWYWQNQKEKEGPKPGEITTDETTNWKTYRNEEYGLEFKYPEDWNDPTIKEGDPYYKGEYFFVGISDKINKRHFSVTVIDEEPPEYIYRGNPSNLLIDGEMRKAFIFPQGWECGEEAYGAEECSSFHIPINKNNKWFLLEGSGEAQEIKGDYKNILSAFKFIK